MYIREAQIYIYIYKRDASDSFLKKLQEKIQYGGGAYILEKMISGYTSKLRNYYLLK